MTKLNELKNELTNIQNQISELSKNQIIITYKELEKTENNLINLIKKEINQIQFECKHPIWYHLSTDNDYYEGRKYFTCKCIDCEKVKEDGAKYFHYILYKNEPYNKIKEEYIKLKNITKNQDVLFNALKEKFTDKISI